MDISKSKAGPSQNIIDRRGMSKERSDLSAAVDRVLSEQSYGAYKGSAAGSSLAKQAGYDAASKFAEGSRTSSRTRKVSNVRKSSRP